MQFLGIMDLIDMPVVVHVKVVDRCSGVAQTQKTWSEVPQILTR